MLDYSSDYRPTNQALSLPTNPINKLALSPDEVAEKLQVDVSDVDSLIENGELIEKKIGDKRRITTNSLLHYLNGESCDIQQPSPGGKHLVTDILDIVLEGKKASCRKLSSYKWYCDIAKHIRVGFRGIFIEDLTQNDILNFMTQVSKNTDGKLMSHHLLVVIRCLLKNIVTFSFSKNFISKNLFDCIGRMPKGKICYSKERVISKNNISSLLIALNHSPTFKPMVILMLRSGLRIGEVLSLHWSDIDYESMVIHVRQSLSLEYDEDDAGNLVNKHYEVGETKTICSMRDVTVDNEVINVLNEWKCYANKESIMRAASSKGNSDIVFINRYGDLRSYQALRQSFNRFLKDNGLGDRHITFHMFRHTYASILQEAGVDINIISELLGHADIQTTANIYVKVNLKPKMRATKLFCKTFESILSD